jgi:hypothetical protein
MLGASADPPPGFQISLIPSNRKLSSFHALGTAKPPPQRNDPAGGCWCEVRSGRRPVLGLAWTWLRALLALRSV